jgi:hypothetical protein
MSRYSRVEHVACLMIPHVLGMQTLLPQLHKYCSLNSLPTLYQLLLSLITCFFMFEKKDGFERSALTAVAQLADLSFYFLPTKPHCRTI